MLSGDGELKRSRELARFLRRSERRLRRGRVMPADTLLLDLEGAGRLGGVPAGFEVPEVLSRPFGGFVFLLFFDLLPE